jgi:hypothetical protein
VRRRHAGNTGPPGCVRGLNQSDTGQDAPATAETVTLMRRTGWAVDFQFDSTTDGRPVKIVSIVDEHTPECLGGLVERSITSDRLIDELDGLAHDRGYPAVLRCDNGPELACIAMADWAGERRARLHPTRPAVAQRLHRIVQRPAPRRMPQHQPVLVTRPCPGRDQRLEDRIQPPPQAFSPRLPDPGSLR